MNKIDVVAIGGMGCNCVSNYLRFQNQQPHPNLNFTLINDDPERLMNFDGRTYLIHSKESSVISKQGYLAFGKNVFLIAGLGGLIGSSITPLVADIAKQQGATVTAIVTTPFAFELAKRKAKADEVVALLQEKCDSVVIFPNNSNNGKPNQTLSSYFESIDKQIFENILRHV